MRTTSAVAALTGAAALLLAGVVPASAASWTHEDAVGDVQYYSFNDRTGKETGPDPDPANTDTDVTSFGARHAARRVVLQATLRDITEASGAIVYRIRTDAHTYEAVQRLGTDRWMAPGFELARADRERPQDCTGVRRSVDRTTEQVMVSIPRSCLGLPAWVRAGAGAYSFSETPPTFTYRLDDALQDGAASERLTLGPRVARG